MIDNSPLAAETEADTRAARIDPALVLAGWEGANKTEGARISREEMLWPGRIMGGGQSNSPKPADYVLRMNGHVMAVMEAKKASLPYTDGRGQAYDYATRIGARFAYCTNGLRYREIDMHTGVERDVDAVPPPSDLWARCYPTGNAWRDRFGQVAFETDGGKWQPRYYQAGAVNACLEAMADGEKRILLTLATGTGKTSIAFQIAWKLFQSRWSLTGEPTRRPRILFLADRNILADQAYNSFSAFEPDALSRINPKEISKKGKMPRNASVFFTIFQTFMTENKSGDTEFNFSAYEPDFFDFIIIDECHRGGAKDESTWRQILEYFEPAVQLGLTATPKRKVNADTYSYFGEPVYTYALRAGIEDGFLTRSRCARWPARLILTFTIRMMKWWVERSTQITNTPRPKSTRRSSFLSASKVAFTSSWTRSTRAKRRWCSARPKTTPPLCATTLTRSKTLMTRITVSRSLQMMGRWANNICASFRTMIVAFQRS